LVLDCAADARMIFIYARTAYEQGYEIALDLVSYYESVPTNYIQTGLAQGFLRIENKDADLSYVASTYTQLVQSTQARVEVTPPEEAIASLVRRHERGCSSLLTEKRN
jgi:hypothetical protein